MFQILFMGIYNYPFSNFRCKCMYFIVLLGRYPIQIKIEVVVVVVVVAVAVVVVVVAAVAAAAVVALGEPLLSLLEVIPEKYRSTFVFNAVLGI